MIGARALLAVLTTIIDLWKVYLKLRNIRSIQRAEEAPSGMNDFITVEDYTALRKRYRNRNIVEILSISFIGCFTVLKLSTSYDEYIWNCTARFGKSLSFRAVLHPALDRFILECFKAPFKGYKIWLRTPSYRMDVLELFIQSIIDIVLKTAQAGGLALALVVITDRFGRVAIPTLLTIYHSLCASFWVLYIAEILPYVSVPLSNDEVGRELKILANSVGYPHEKIRISVSDVRLEDVSYYRLLGYQEVIVCRRLLRLLVPIQITAVVAQKLGEWKYRHKTVLNFFGAVEALGYGYALTMSYGNNNLTVVFDMKQYGAHPYTTLDFTIRYVWPICKKCIRGIGNIVKRTCVLQADDFASDHGLASSLKTAILIMAGTSKSPRLFDSLHSAWFYGEPTTIERVARLIKRKPKPNVTFDPVFIGGHLVSPVNSDNSEANVTGDEVTNQNENWEESEEESSEAQDLHGTPSEGQNDKTHMEGSKSPAASPSKPARTSSREKIDKKLDRPLSVKTKDKKKS